MPVSSTRSLVLLIFILASHVTDTLARHHHIKLRHERHRRQHGESYLPSSFVLDTDEEERGNWGPWSIPSSCSRSCGGGVAHQTRRCHDIDDDGVERCSGSKKRFFSCNVQECPDPERDFRAEQCAEFNNVPIEGVYYDWIPYTGAPNKCELNCMPRGERFFYRHKLSVTDGTPCTNEQNDVCVEGKCRPVGCDMMLGSGAKEDRCRECGGDGSACDTVQGLLDMNDLQVGYNDILLIPAGATNIAIAEVRPSNNYLAIRNQTGHYYLNGNWRIDFPRSLKFVGSVFYYERKPKEFLAADMISALGPTTEALYIVLLYQDKNVGVKYEYSIPKKFSQKADPDSYTWVTEEYSECSVTCGGGIQSRLVRCVRRRDTEEADPNLCDQQLEPDSTQACAEEPCPPEWVIGNWGPCSEGCKPGGEQTREIKCQRVISGDIPSLVDDHTCLELIGPKDIEIQECNKDVECPNWHIGPWKPCDHLCGEGKQTRKITCYKKVEGKVFALPDSACHEERPESEKDCELRPCAGVDWVVSKWSGCDDNCGLNLETRTTSCVTLEGKVYPDDKCNAETKPKLMRECAAPDKCEYQWFATQWSECSAKCGSGIQTRNVFCANISPDLGTITKVESGKCDPEKKYNDTKDCVAEVEECGGEWFAGPWSECSKPCGGGDKTRKVICMKGGRVVPIKGNCEQHNIMFSSEVCNEKACEDDEVLPVEPDKISSLGEGDEEECEDYEDDELVIVGPDQPLVDGDDTSPFGSSSGDGEDEQMMGDDPRVQDELSLSAPLDDDEDDYGGESGSGDDTDFFTDSTTDDYFSTFEGSGSTITTDWDDTDSTITSSGSTQSANTETTSKNTGATEPPASPTKFKDIFDDFFPEVDTPKKSWKQSGGSVATTKSSSTTDSTISSDSDSSPSSSTGETDETSESISTSSSESTSESTASSDSSSSDTATETTASSGLESDETSSSSDTTLSSANPEATETGTTESSSFETTVSPSSDSTESESTKLSETEETGSSSSDTTVQSSSEATQSSEITGSTSSDTTESTGSETTLLSGSESTESSSFETTVSSSSDTTISGTSGSTESSTSDSTGSSISETEVSGTSGSTESSTSESTESSTSESTGSSVSETEVSGSSGPTESSTSESTGSSVSETEVSGSSGTTESSTSESTGSSISETEVSGTSGSTESSTSDSTGSSISETEVSGTSGSTESSTSESTGSSVSETEVSGSSGTTESSTSESTGSSISETEVSGTSGSTESSTSDSTGSSISETEVSGTSGSTESSTSESTGSSVSETEVSGSSGPTESSTSDSTGSTISETEVSGTSGSTESSTSESTGSSISETEVSGSSGPTESSTSESTGSSISETEVSGTSGSTESPGSTESTVSGSPSGSTETTELSSSESTVSGSSETTESSGSTETTVFSSTESTVFSETETTESTESSSSSETTLSGSSSESSETTGSDTSTDTTVSGDVGASESSTEPTEFTESTETTFSGETELTTDSGFTSEGTWETTESGLTSETDEEIDTTGQSHITDLFTTLSPIDQAITKEHKRRKCKARKHKKTCRTSQFGCCYDGIKAATGPFGKGCPIPETCKETEYGCCPDEVSPAAGPNNKGCPDSHCDETLFGCCPDNITPAEGNDFEGCPRACNETEFGCCPDDKTPAAGQDYLGCCNTTEHGCCPDGITAASGPHEEGCEVETTSPMTSTTTEEITTEISTSTTVEEGCASTEFGCCPEGKEPASGTDFAGCKEINRENCTESYYGCCPDQTSPALGENNKGCRMPCESSTFGCCTDGVTPAHGPYYDGCCLSTPYGCCPDNIRFAQGPNLYGCGCEYSGYGCCPDNITTALGPNNEGCRCEHTTHGCCPNRINAASGPDFEGCACHTYQFGCCPDGISVAKGPQGLGCGCESTEFRCCSDGKTPAKGPNYAGCTCDASKYGCCPDGVEEAQGENFEGCRTVPLAPGAACTLEKDRGTCWDLTVKWYYDTEYGGCSRFWYGGCEGNENRFKSQEECKQVCVEPKGRDACFLPKISGPCEGYHPTWYYDSERKQCGQFIYSGCNGNANKFKTIEECEELCVLPDEIDGCEQPKESGPCEGNFTRWYFNKESSRCEEFNYGGCKSNKNNFPTEISCQQQCLPPGRSRDSCSLQKEEGTCTEKYARWSFDQSENRCMPFYYTGCGGNENNYETKDACDSDCPPKIEQDICLLPAIIGDCHNWTQRWYYDAYEKQCRQFYWGGCGGNGNNFQTEYDCMHRCTALSVTEPTPVEEFRTEFCFQPEDNRICAEQSIKWFYDAGQGICKQFRYGGCSSSGNKFATVEECEYRCGNVQDLCDLPPIPGPCGAATRRFYYDRSRDSCLEFDYGGCQGNKNNFEDRSSCEQRCKGINATAIATTLAPVPVTVLTLTTPKPRDRIPAVSPTCSAPLDAGNCDADITAYWYNPEERICQAFIYGGCDGNANRFQTEEQCERLCGSFVGQDVCNLRVDTGPCRGAFPKYYYDYVTRTCREFLYGGCDGNANRFSTISECESICIHREEPPVSGNGTAISNLATCREPVDVGSCSTGEYIRFYYDDDRLTCLAFIYTGCGGNRNRFKTFNSCIKTCSPTINEVDVGPGPDSKDPCRDARVECETIRCPYGKEEYVDSDDCQRCRCADPCSTERCPEGTRCAITLTVERGTNIYKGICRPTTKPGNCPSVLNSTTCEEECSSDADCPEDYKCCSNGCGTSCLQPAPTEPVTTTFEPVTVLDAEPVPASVKEPENSRPSAPEGGYVILQCITSGNPRPIISWRKGVSLIDNSLSRYSIGSDGALQIVGLYRSDAGIYTCTATNRLAAPVRIQYVLEITAPVEHTSAILGAIDYRVTVTLNSPAVLPCYAWGWPRPSVTWWHGDQILPLNDPNRELQRDHSLMIHRVSLTHLGVYTCQAYNGIRKPASWSVTLQAPGPVYNISPENLKYAKYLISPPSRPGPTRPHQRPPVPETQTYAPYPNERPNRITARPVTNPSHVIVIPGRFRVPLKVTVPEATEPYPVGSEFTIPCNVDSWLKPTVVWFKDDIPIQTNDRIKISDANRLIISDAEKTDSGTYRCEATTQDQTASGSVNITVEGIYIHPNCQDNLFLARCDLIVKAKYCQHTYYAKFCCRSCTEAGQLPARGPHINDTRRRRRSPSFLSLF
ncbi:papilin isoform X3 [Athalia rosae]|uniref:papilin isoform X3 n=1 Tax=Athalia rosae TaxID=37344 RepID=UPI002033DDD6|nr:papilin isoform X3 [Athalia rosae]